MNISVINDGDFFIYNPQEPDSGRRLSVCAYLVRDGKENVLIDAGPGSIQAYDKVKYRTAQPRNLISFLKNTGTDPKDIGKVILTHLHFDHSDGIFDISGSLLFQNAEHIINSREWEYFMNSPEYSSERKKLYSRIEMSGRISLTEKDHRVSGRINVVFSPGHTPGFQHAEVEDEHGRLHIFPGDIIPTVWHLNNDNPEGKEYDPKLLKKNKDIIISKAIEMKAVVYFQHSAGIKPSELVRRNGRISVKRI